MDYKGYQVLTVEPNRIVDEKVSVALSADVLDNITGRAYTDRLADTPVLSRSFEWTMMERGEILEFKEWLIARKGRLVPFWAPSWQHDLPPVAATDNSALLDIVNVGYTMRLFHHQARRYLIVFWGGLFTIRQIIEAVDLGSTERLTLDAPVTIPAGALVSFLVFYRLGSDSAMLSYMTQGAAECSLTFVELPREVP